MSNNIEVTLDNIHDLIEEWHESDSDKELHEYLGMSFEEYAYWVQTDSFK